MRVSPAEDSMDRSAASDTRVTDDAGPLRAILEGTARHTGARFFEALVENLALALGTHGAWVTEYLPEPGRLRAFAFWLGGRFVPDYEYAIEGTPCGAVVLQACTVHVPDRVVELYPADPDLRAAGALSYLGVPLIDLAGGVLGHLAVLDTQPMPADSRVEAVMGIFAARATAELQRLRAEADLRDRESELRGVLAGTMDAILELDDRCRVSLANPAALRLFDAAAGDLVGVGFETLLAGEARLRWPEVLAELRASSGVSALWIPGGLAAARRDGTAFTAEATISAFSARGATRYALVLRDEEERLRAEERIRSLASQRTYLQEELRELRHFDEILGRSVPLLGIVEAIRQVAGTDATALVLGETGTGKELVARAIHAESARRERPLIVVNCAAIPAALMESELFGHEKGAFTGATQRREGRFALADGGTIFLDEIGELPLDLQAKLLRVFQIGEFELVGSARTRSVDVRVVAATNRDLATEVRAGRFREDLYYRLDVFPIRVPPLRERGEDVLLLADAFVRRFAARLGRAIAPISPADRRRLLEYRWPGNVRELQNVIERAVITARDGRLDLSAALPAAPAAPAGADAAETVPEAPIYTADELKALERANILRALEAAGWKVAGPQGAAQLLALPPSTLTSRMLALGIERPPRE